LEEKIREAVADEASRAGAISQAAGSVPLLRNRPCENEVAQAEFMMVFDAQLYEPHAARWWADFARMNRSAFEKQAANLIRPHGALAALRAVASTSAADILAGFIARGRLGYFTQPDVRDLPLMARSRHSPKADFS
jgi:hypothetical protein